MDVRQIETYQAVMTFGTTSKAAEVLGMSQPAVSKAIMTLERSIGFKLFDREKGRLTPSAEGQLFYREVQASLAGIAKLRSSAARIRDYGSGDVRVACRLCRKPHGNIDWGMRALPFQGVRRCSVADISIDQ